MESLCSKCGSAYTQGDRFCARCGVSLVGLSGRGGGDANTIPSASRHNRLPLTRSRKFLYVGMIAAISFVFLYLFTAHLPGGSNPVIAAEPDVAMSTMYMGQNISQQFIEASVQDGFVVFPLSLLLEKKIVAFDYSTATTNLPLLAYISSDGKLVTAVRMCEPCNSSTFRIEGLELVCGNCGTRWKLTNLEGVSGSCQKYPPDPIPSSVVGDQVRIDEKYLKNWKMRI